MKYTTIPHIGGVPLRLMTRRQIINFVANKLEAQGAPCRQGATCLYADGAGNHCAAGWLVPTCRSLPIRPWNMLARELQVPQDHCALIQRLQNMHDNWEWDDRETGSTIRQRMFTLV